MIQSHVPPPSEDVLVLVCGPDPMLASIAGPKGKNFTQGELSGLLKDLGYTSEQVYKF
jgi:cytochrome-b5 reductase